MGDVGTMIASISAVIIGIVGIVKYLPVVSSNLAATISGNKASDNIIGVLQKLVDSEREGRLAAEAETRKFISNWAEMKSKFDVMEIRCADSIKSAEAAVKKASDDAVRESTRNKKVNEALQAKVDCLTQQVEELKAMQKQVEP